MMVEVDDDDSCERWSDALGVCGPDVALLKTVLFFLGRRLMWLLLEPIDDDDEW